jgi:hypothetical protein
MSAAGTICPFNASRRAQAGGGDEKVKHAGPEVLAALADLISAIRTRGLKEPRPGIFHRKGKAWLHFHEDETGLFADIRVGAEWDRFRVSDPEERANLLAFVDDNL